MFTIQRISSMQICNHMRSLARGNSKHALFSINWYINVGMCPAELWQFGDVLLPVLQIPRLPQHRRRRIAAPHRMMRNQQPDPATVFMTALEARARGPSSSRHGSVGSPEKARPRGANPWARTNTHTCSFFLPSFLRPARETKP